MENNRDYWTFCNYIMYCSLYTKKIISDFYINVLKMYVKIDLIINR